MNASKGTVTGGAERWSNCTGASGVSAAVSPESETAATRSFSCGQRACRRVPGPRPRPRLARGYGVDGRRTVEGERRAQAITRLSGTHGQRPRLRQGSHRPRRRHGGRGRAAVQRQGETLGLGPCPAVGRFLVPVNEEGAASALRRSDENAVPGLQLGGPGRWQPRMGVGRPYPQTPAPRRAEPELRPGRKRRRPSPGVSPTAGSESTCTTPVAVPARANVEAGRVRRIARRVLGPRVEP